MSDRLMTAFAEAGSLCADQDQLGEAFTELARRVDLDDINRALCYAAPDRYGLCPECGKAFDRRDGHDPGGCMFALPVAVVRLCRRLGLRARFHVRRLVALFPLRYPRPVGGDGRVPPSSPAGSPQGTPASGERRGRSAYSPPASSAPGTNAEGGE